MCETHADSGKSLMYRSRIAEARVYCPETLQKSLEECQSSIAWIHVLYNPEHQPMHACALPEGLKNEYDQTLALSNYTSQEVVHILYVP